MAAGKILRLIKRVRKIAKSDYSICFITSDCPCICISAWNNSAPNGRICMQFDIYGLLEYLSTKFIFINI